MATGRGMKLVSVLHFPEFGGPHNQALRLAPALEGHGVESVTVLPEGPGAERLRAAGLNVRTVPLGRIRAVKSPRTQLHTLTRLPLDLIALGRIFREERADVVQLNGLINPHAAIAAKALGIPVVWQLLDTRPPMRLRKVMMPIVRRLSDVVMPVGYEVARLHPGTIELGDRMVVFYPPVDTMLFSPEIPSTLRQELGIALDDPLIGVVGNVNPQKGHETLIEAVGIARRRIPNVRLVIAGHIYPNHRAYYQELVALAQRWGMEPGKDVYFLGSRSDVPNVLAALDVFALASVPNSEGTPTAILEAMASGVPVVASNVASIPEVVADGETGYLVAPGDATALSNRLTDLLSNEAFRRRMGARSRARVESLFSLDQCVATHLEGYRRAIAQRKGTRYGQG